MKNLKAHVTITLYLLWKRRSTLTAKGRHPGEGYHSPGLQIQAASLISEGPPIGLQGQTYERAHCAAHHSC